MTATGVLLQVTPHINAGGLVTLDVNAEVSTPGTTTDPTLAPPINTRSVQTLLLDAQRHQYILDGKPLRISALITIIASVVLGLAAVFASSSSGSAASCSVAGPK